MKEPSRATEPMLAIRPFSGAPSALATSSVLPANAAHL